MTTIRDLVNEMKAEIGKGDVSPERTRVLLAKLTALIGNCNDTIRLADADYATVLLVCLGSDEAAARAKIRAETSAEYKWKREARDTKELVIELVRSLKYILRSVEEEMRLGGRVGA